MDESFTITYETENGLIKGKTILVTSPQMNKREASKFIGAVGGKKLRKITRNGVVVDSEIALSILREAKVFSK
jgi:hypothetical protein